MSGSDKEKLSSPFTRVRSHGGGCLTGPSYLMSPDTLLFFFTQTSVKNVLSVLHFKNKLLITGMTKTSNISGLGLYFKVLTVQGKVTLR